MTWTEGGEGEQSGYEFLLVQLLLDNEWMIPSMATIATSFQVRSCERNGNVGYDSPGRSNLGGCVDSYPKKKEIKAAFIQASPPTVSL